MDPLSQAVLGAAAAQSGPRKVPLKTALWVGALGGVLPDIDILIRSSSDPLLFLDYHRHFTHSLAFIPVGGLIAASLARWISRGRHRIRALWLPATLGLGTHGLLDSCTSYGTFLLWPFSSARIAWHNVAIIDPLFTLPLLAGVLLAVRYSNRLIARSVLAFSIAYLLFGVVQRERAHKVYQTLQQARGHQPNQVEVKPSIGNNILFRGFYRVGDVYHADAIRVPWWGPTKVYPGTTATALDPAAVTADLPPIHARDVMRFVRFSAGYIIAHPGEPGIISDFRYSAVPNTVAPLWGIDLGGAKPGKHLDFRRFNQVGEAQRSQLVDQLMGR
jgi:inner membrane protein